MDLRMIKTRAAIKAAFLKLREKCMPDKIKVKDICEVAMINKSTFYHHYTDSNQLSDEIDDSAIDKVLAGFPERDKIFSEPKAYIIGLLRALERESDELKIIFRGKHEVLCAKLEGKLHELYDGAVRDTEDGIRLSFIIGGFSRVVKDYVFSTAKYSIDELSDVVSRLFAALPPRAATLPTT